MFCHWVNIHSVFVKVIVVLEHIKAIWNIYAVSQIQTNSNRQLKTWVQNLSTKLEYIVVRCTIYMYMWLVMLTVLMGTKTEARFSSIFDSYQQFITLLYCGYLWDVSDIHKCSGSFQMTQSSLDWTAKWKSPHNWLLLFSIDLATFCDLWISKWPLFTPFSCVSVWHES